MVLFLSRWIFLFSIFLVTAYGCVHKDKECPNYSVISSYPDYEIRSYPSLAWIRTTEKSNSYRISSFKMFMRLFRYIRGRNEKGIAINMTVPVRTMEIKDTPQNTYQMDFMVPAALLDDVPLPRDPQLHVVREGPKEYAVRSFPGYVLRFKAWETEAIKLYKHVANDTTVDKSQYFMCGFDAPFSFFNRHNEIWMPVIER